jgi:hypothetical protein
MCFSSFAECKDDKPKKPKRPPLDVIQAKLDSICEEGYNLYHAERVNWMATDSVLSRYSQESIGGNIIWQPTKDYWGVAFFDAGLVNCVFELSYNKLNGKMIVSYDKRPIREAERKRLEFKRLLFKNGLEKYGEQIGYDKNCGGPNFDFVRINDNLIRLYILQGTVHHNTIPIGNDYSIDFDNEGNALCFRRYHKSLLAMKTVDDSGKPVETLLHSHTPDNPYITATDICNFLLYRGGMASTTVISTALDGQIIYHADSKRCFFLPIEALKKILNHNKK